MGRVALLGTGIMGGPMARNLLRAGHEVTVWNRTVQKTEALKEEGARRSVDPRSFLEAISGGAMDMPYAHLKGEAILNQDFPASFPLVHARKDVALILEAAGGVELPLVCATFQRFDRAVELGHGDEDMSAVYYASAASAGVRS
jgi:3-hydroxyisobutyrate dehydrogenase